MSEWIKCSDRMPNGGDHEVFVLVYADGAMNCLAYYKGEWQDWCKANHLNVAISDITHWMPLPLPPAA